MTTGGANTGNRLGLYVHWPFCKSKCPYCDFNSHVSENIDQDGFAEGLRRELTSLATRLSDRPKLHSIFFGGGTPSLMPPATLASVIDHADQIFGFEDDIEITAEANPTSVETDNLAAFHLAGVNRVSLGIQALEPAHLAFLGREHSAADALSAIETAQQHFSRVSIDLIYGLPDQSVSQWQNILARLLSLGLDHLSLYQLTIEQGTAFYSRANRGDVMTGPDDTVARQFEVTNDIMAGAGLPAYEVSNHARPGHECRHNLIYWRAQNWIGIGPGAHSRFNHSGNRVALATRRNPASWLALTAEQDHAIETEQIETASDHAAEMLMMGLRLTEGVCLRHVENHCGARGDWLDEAAVTAHLDNKLLELVPHSDGERLKTTPKGRLFLNRILADILA
ncbi:MAG: radical SAM family heme chaperone HemW [Alphaproteobacteria bacterium]